MVASAKVTPKRVLTRPSPLRKSVVRKSNSPTPSKLTPVDEDVEDSTETAKPHQPLSRTPQRKLKQPSKISKRKARASSDADYEPEDGDKDAVHVRLPAAAKPGPRADSSEAARLTQKEPPKRKTPPKNPSPRPATPPPGRNRGLVDGSSLKVSVKVMPGQGPVNTSGTSAGEAAGVSSGPPKASLRTNIPPPRTALAPANLTKRPPPDGAAGVVVSASKRVRIQEPSALSAPAPPQPAAPEEASGSSSVSNSSEAGSPSEKEFLLIEQADGLFQDIMARPRALELGEMSALFVRLQEMSFRFADRHFNHKLTARQEAAWPLHLLSTRYKPLMLMTQFIADGSHYGWRNFFTKPEHRVPLIHGIIGEWCKHRIFNHTAFSVPEEHQELLETVDHVFIHYDAFVRSKKRAEILESLKFDYGDDDDNEDDPYFPDEHSNNLDVASFELAGHLLQLIEPLLPPPIYDPLRDSSRPVEVDRELANSSHFDIFMELVDLFRLAGSLHLCIRLTGLNGTIVRIAPHLPKGSVYDRSPDTNNICVNADFCNATKPKRTGSRDVLQVKMTCWGRVEAVVPHGPDRLQLECHRDEIQKTLGEDAPFTWKDVEDRVFPVLPYDLQKDDAGRAVAETETPVPGTGWSIRIAQAAAEEKRKYTFGKKGGLDDGEDELSSSSSAAEGGDEAKPRPPKPLRGSFVTVYPNVAPANVYCVWANDARPMFPTSAADLSTESGQTLEEAVAKAREAKGMYYRVEDLGIQTANIALEYRAFEWALASGMVGGLASGILLLAIQTATKGGSTGLRLESIPARFSQLARKIGKFPPLPFDAPMIARYLSALGKTMRQSGEMVKQTALELSALRPMAWHGLPSTTTLMTTLTGWTTVTVPPSGAPGFLSADAEDQVHDYLTPSAPEAFHQTLSDNDFRQEPSTASMDPDRPKMAMVQSLLDKAREEKENSKSERSLNF